MGQDKSTLSKSESVSKDLICDTCRSGGQMINASTLCVDCMECLCKDCTEKHEQNEALMTHKFFNKVNLASSVTQNLVHELKSIVYCSVHEVPFDHICEDHKKLICRACIKKSHRDCTKISKIQLSPESAGETEAEIKSRIQDVRSLWKKYTEVSNELKRQTELRSAILEQIRSFVEQLDKQEENQQIKGSNEEREGELEKLEEYLQTVKQLGDHEKTALVSEYVQLSLTDPKMFPKVADNTDGKEPNLSEVCRNSERLEALKHIVNELVNASNNVDTVRNTDESQDLVEADSRPARKPATYNSSDRTGKNVEREKVVEPDDRQTIKASQQSATCTEDQAVASSDADMEPR